MTYMLSVDEKLPLTSFGSLIRFHGLANIESRAKKDLLMKRPR